jgi:hypothetical protein
METRLVKYLKDGHNLIGCVVGLPDGSIGISVCNSGNKQVPADKFNKVRGIELASQRARNSEEISIPHRTMCVKTGPYTYENVNLVDLVNREVAVMENRVKKYYKLESVKPRITFGQRLKTALASVGL